MHLLLFVLLIFLSSQVVAATDGLPHASGRQTGGDARTNATAADGQSAVASEKASERAADPRHSPVQVVETLHAALIDALSADQEFDARYEFLEPVLVEVFDVAAIARISVGSHWAKLDESQRAELIDTLSTLIVTTYAARFDSANGARFETLESSSGRPGRYVVRTRLHLLDRESVTFDYLLRDVNGKPKIYNVSADGVSDLSLRRAEYGAILGRQGFPELLTALRASIAEFVSDANGSVGPSDALSRE